jgi:hypothetical protein
MKQFPYDRKKKEEEEISMMIEKKTKRGVNAI